MTRFRLLVPALLTGLALGGPAWAHAHLEGAEPAAKATVAAAPKELKLTFSEGIEPRFSVVKVTGPDGKVVPVAALATAPGDSKIALVELKAPLKPGIYKVEWRVVSEDSHKTHGTYGFTVKP